MFHCSASVCSSATDFCFNSAISTGGTPGGRARPEVGLGGWVVNARPSEVGLYVVGAERRSLQDVVGRGVSGRTRKLRKVEAERRGVKGLNRRNPPRGLAFGPGTGASLYCITPWWVQ